MVLKLGTRIARAVCGCGFVCGFVTREACPEFTESHNHRIVGVGRDPWRSPSPALLPRQVTQERVQVTLGCLQRGRLRKEPAIGFVGEMEILL